MHIHTRLMKDGDNAMVENGKLSDTARKAIAGYLDLAPSLTAFGNTNPTSYFRLVPHQEAPTNICWGDRNRSVLVRVPLGWTPVNMIFHVNPQETVDLKDFTDKQTVEFRCPDGSADVYLLLAGLTVAARHGLEMENALQMPKTLMLTSIFLIKKTKLNFPAWHICLLPAPNRQKNWKSKKTFILNTMFFLKAFCKALFKCLKSTMMRN